MSANHNSTMSQDREIMKLQFRDITKSGNQNISMSSDHDFLRGRAQSQISQKASSNKPGRVN
jgi:hypothetical protein